MKKILLLLILPLLIFSQNGIEKKTSQNTVIGLKSVNVVSYKSYVAKITQLGTLDPTVTVLQNDFGFNITWTRNIAGKYFGLAPNGSFPINKRFALIGTSTLGSDEQIGKTLINVTFNGMGTSGVCIRTLLDGVMTDAKMFETEIEIRIYN